MKKFYLTLLVHHFSIIFIFLNGCTENPFFKEDTITGNQTIRGKVELSDQASPESVFVWLEGFTLSTWTDQNGAFQITLPPPTKQTGGGLSGVFKLYFYVANYQIDTAKVLIRNGAIIYAQADVDEKGELKQTQYLSNLLDIRLGVSPPFIAANDSDSIFVTIELQAERDSVAVIMPNMNHDVPKGRKDLLSVCFLKKIDSKEDFVKIIDGGGNIQRSYKVGTVALNWILIIRYTPGMLPAGEYQIVPYLLIQQQEVPSGLINSLGEDVEKFDLNYLNMPYKLNGGNLRVVTTE